MHTNSQNVRAPKLTGMYTKRFGIRLQNKFAVRKVNTLYQPSKKIKATRLLCGTNLRRFSLANKKILPSSLLSQHGEVVDDLADIADIFNEHFSTVGERLVSNATPRGLVDDNIHLTRINSLEGKCTLPDITEEYVQKQISSMSVGQATGPDGISVKMLQIASMYITKSLTHIFNLSIRCEHYPKDWKYALVTPIHKGGDKCNKLTIALFPYCQLSPKSWSDGLIQ